MNSNLDSLPTLTGRQAHLAMYETLKVEFDLAEKDKTLHLGGLLAELEPMLDGSTSDPGAALKFFEAVKKILGPSYSSPWREGRS